MKCRMGMSMNPLNTLSRNSKPVLKETWVAEEHKDRIKVILAALYSVLMLLSKILPLL